MTTQKAEIQTTETPKISIEVFGKKSGTEILVPPYPSGVRNDCQSGRWVLAKEEYDSKGLEMAIIKLEKVYGTLGKTTGEWGQLWFVVEAGELPKGVVMFTYIKTETLSNFESLLVKVMAQGLEPAEGLFMPTFVKRQSQKFDPATGQTSPVNYYAIEWKWKARETAEEKARFAPFARLVIATQNDALIASKLIDTANPQLKPQGILAATETEDGTPMLPAGLNF